MPTSVWASLGGPTVYQFDGVPNTWSSAIGLGSTAPWSTGAPVQIALFHVDWHYGGAWLQDGSPGGVSGAAGPFKLQGSNDGSTWFDVVVDDNPVATWSASWPGDFSGDYVIDPPVTYLHWRWTNTISGANNDWYELAAYGPEVEPPVVPGVNITIDGVAFTRPMEVTIRVELNAAGQGTIVLDRNDPQCTAANLQRGNIVTVTIPEIDPDDPIFAFILEDGDWDLISSDEEGGEELRFTGPGVLHLLSRCVVDWVEYEDGLGYPRPLKGYWEFPTDSTEGHILNKMMREATSSSRPQHPIAGVTWDFSDSHDSSDPDVDWSDTTFEGKWRIPIGSDLYSQVLRLVASGLMAVEMGPDLVLHVYRDRGEDRTGDFGTGVIRFEKGVNIADELVRTQAGREFASHGLGRYDDGSYTRAPKDGTWPYVQEAFFDGLQTTHENTAKRMMKGQLGWLEAAQDAPLFAHIVPWPGHGNDEANGIYLPGPDWSDNGLYWVGDLVTLHTGTGELDYDEYTGRVYAITLRMDETGYLAPPVVELNAGATSLGGGITISGGRYVPNAVTSSGGGGGGSGGGSGGGGTPTAGAFQPIAEKGQPDGYASLDDDGLVPIDQLGTGGDGSGDNVLHDDGTWSPGADTIPAHTYELANEGGDPLVHSHGNFGATETIDPTLGNVHTGTLNADCTVTLSASSGDAASLLLWLTQDGTGARDITWAGSVSEIGSPNTSAGTTNIAVATTVDGGTSWVVAWVGGGGSGSLALDDLTDVIVTSVAENDTLRRIGGVWVNDNRRWEPVWLAGELVWDGDDLVLGWSAY